MKPIEYYLTLPYRMEIVPDITEDGYVASYPELPGCISSGETIATAVTNLEDAKKSWLEAALEDHLVIPEPNDLESYSGQFKLRIPKSLHRQLSEHARQEGTSMNQYCLYLLTKFDTQYHPQ